MKKFFLFDLDGSLLKKGGCKKSFSGLKKDKTGRLLLRVLMNIYELIEFFLVLLGLLGPVEVDEKMGKIFKIIALKDLKYRYEEVRCGILTNRSKLGLKSLAKRERFPDLELFELIFMRKSIFSKITKLRRNGVSRIIELKEIKPHSCAVETVLRVIEGSIEGPVQIEVVDDCPFTRNLFLARGIKTYHPSRFVPKF